MVILHYLHVLMRQRQNGVWFILDNLNKLKPIQYEPGHGVEEADNLFNKCDGIWRKS